MSADHCVTAGPSRCWNDAACGAGGCPRWGAARLGRGSLAARTLHTHGVLPQVRGVPLDSWTGASIREAAEVAGVDVVAQLLPMLDAERDDDQQGALLVEVSEVGGRDDGLLSEDVGNPEAPVDGAERAVELGVQRVTPVFVHGLSLAGAAW